MSCVIELNRSVIDINKDTTINVHRTGFFTSFVEIQTDKNYITGEVYGRSELLRKRLNSQLEKCRKSRMQN